MASSDRSISDVLQDIVRDIQEIMRAEFRLARTEIGQEAVKVKSAALLVGSGAAAGLLGVLFLLIAATAALSLVMAVWLAALIVGVVLSGIAAGVLTAGWERLAKVHPKPERTVETLRENAEWVKQRTR